MDLYTLLNEEASKAGFPACGGLDFNHPELEQTFRPHLDFFDEWLSHGYHGSMEYLQRGRERRAHPTLLMPEAKSIFCVALPYSTRPAGSLDPKSGPRYARYLKQQDYHHTIAEQLERMMNQVQTRWSETHPEHPIQWKVCVDTSAILERTWAALTGLGWIGKNTLLIHPKLGSYLFLAEVLINLPLNRGPQPLPNLCGNCTRCLSACPTQALIEPQKLDATRCISYWTLEKRGDLNLTSEQKQKIGSWIAGCDLCQEVCPFNLKPSKKELLNLQETGSSDETLISDWITLLKETPEEYKKRIKNSALSRVKPAQFSRNLAILLRNQWSDLDRATLKPWIEKRMEQEQDPFARQEWLDCLMTLNQMTSDSHVSMAQPLDS